MKQKTKKNKNYCGVGGQAVLEGVMMKSEEKYAIAVRKPNGAIDIDIENFQGIIHESKIKKIPFIRGMFNFIDSMILGTKCLNHSADLMDEDSSKDKSGKKEGNSVMEKVMMAGVTVLSIVLALGIFIGLPYLIITFLSNYVLNHSLLLIIEGLIRIVIFIIYVSIIALMKDIKRLYMYHGAEHKCINCLERGRELTVKNAMRSSRLHKRCGTSFIFFVLFISIIFFFFIRVDDVFIKLALRIILMPVIAGVSYEVIRLAGNHENILIKILSAPGMFIQKITTKEPTADMIEVAIAAVEGVYDWKAYLIENHGYKEEDFSTEQEEE